MDGILFLAHGTIGDTSELPEFLKRIRRGRAASDELIQELRRRYETIGGSPLLETTKRQADAVSELTKLPSFVAMRLWHPTVEEVLPRVRQAGVTRLCLLPLAQFSVEVYANAAREAIAARQAITGSGDASMDLVTVPNWSQDPAYLDAQAQLIARHLPDEPCTLIMTAHSLPMAVIARGDNYARDVEVCHEAITSRLGHAAHLAYQSEGADGGQWLGPSLKETLEHCAAAGERHVVVAPIGFLADHVETLYDLDIEAREHARALNLRWTRVPALGLDSAFIAALADLAERTLASAR